MELFFRSFAFFILGLLLMWGIFVTFVILFKNKIGQRIKDIHNFKERYKDLDEAIERKKQEARQKDSAKKGRLLS